ncbi:MAG TPA: ATP synthase F0 subunit B [Myxococcota bacterium]|jgi:F-type H+-transporting ATPase subunit b|nr:ATP synthase F0 subunit B [Myxococcota bacterium]
MFAPRTLVTFALALLLPCVGFAEEAAHGEGHGVSPMTIVWQAVNLLLLIGVIVYYGRGPIRDFFHGRRREISENLDRAASLLSEAEGRVRQWEARMTRLDAEIEEIRRNTRERAEAERARILADARAAATRIRNDAAAAVEQEVRGARESLRAEAAQLAVDLATELLHQHVNDGDRKRLVDEFVAQVESAPRASARS